MNVRYGISFISEEQAQENLEREINTYRVDDLARIGKDIWNETLGKIEVGEVPRATRWSFILHFTVLTNA